MAVVITGFRDKRQGLRERLRLGSPEPGCEGRIIVTVFMATHLVISKSNLAKTNSQRQMTMTTQYAEEKRWVFNSDLKEESQKECLTVTETLREEESSRSRVRCIERIFPLGSSCPSLEHRRAKYLRLSEECKKESKKENRYGGAVPDNGYTYRAQGLKEFVRDLAQP